ncbi:uncharacterized protein LOC128033775 [Gossypium raimondii]|uniref:Uncharacterized protein n=1 Tax=Gossypium raimondii TaxID=29730 RepID=A0A0D2RLP5_GOSRA|nr:uncharacterized protein LOC128033775 [Gossypium raimondii]KJB71582.1 hypothetical protein B456_011G130800 [Gossypium raimondii]
MFRERCFTWYYFTKVEVEVEVTFKYGRVLELSSLLGCFEKLGLVDRIWRALKEYGHGSHVSSSVRLKEELFLCWDKLANGWCKSNTDGSWFQDINCECKGSISIRNYNIDLAELRRILYGIDLAD